ncbi:MAG: polysaccharide deacetylase family protein [Hyphomicrobiales bacterium]|nr:polysaccharide deacetylase family protein [Hyphomicrobiales bacterium]
MPHPRPKRPDLPGCVLAYHSVAHRLPGAAGYHAHNVPPPAFRRQAAWLARHYQVVTLDDWMAAGDVAGLAAITFDDGYDSVFTQALPILRDLALPATVFLCDRLLRGEPYWRDLLRHLITTGRFAAFRAFAEPAGVLAGADLDRDPYAATRAPAVDSARLAALLDDFVAAQVPAAELDGLRGLYRRAADLVDHPLVAYGNHTLTHPVMASLGGDAQHAEIAGMEAVLDRLGLRRSRVFGIPFGNPGDADPATERACAALGLTGMVYCRRAWPTPWPGPGPDAARHPGATGLPVAHRLVMPPHAIAFGPRGTALANRLRAARNWVMGRG